MDHALLVFFHLFGHCFIRCRDAEHRFLAKQIEILQRILADQGITRVIATPSERLALLAIGSELSHKVSDLFRLNAWKTYQGWLRDQAAGVEPKRPGRPKTFTAEQIALVVRLAKENLSWGLGKLVGELKKLGIFMTKNTVKATLTSHGIPPADDRKHKTTGAWKTFHANLDTLVACDFLTKPVWGWCGRVEATVLVFLHLGTRKVWTSPACYTPGDNWVRQQAINAVMRLEDEGLPFRHLIRDHDSKFTARFDAIWQDAVPADVENCVVKTDIRVPVMNAFVESWIGHCKAECLDHFVCFSLRQIDRIMAAYQTYHNQFRPHQGRDIGNRILDPDWQAPPPTGTVKCKPFLGGLLNHYYREAA